MFDTGLPTASHTRKSGRSYRYRALVQPTINLMIRYVCVNFVWIREHNSSDGDHLRFNQGYLKTTTITVDITVLSPQGEGEKDS